MNNAYVGHGFSVLLWAGLTALSCGIPVLGIVVLALTVFNILVLALTVHMDEHPFNISKAKWWAKAVAFALFPVLIVGTMVYLGVTGGFSK